MPIYHIEHECNGHTEQSPHGVELASLAEVTAYAIATARLFQDLIPGERRDCAFKVRGTSEGSRLNIVMMGQGEPLHNLPNVVKATRLLVDPQGVGLSPRRVTVSTFTHRDRVGVTACA